MSPSSSPSTDPAGFHLQFLRASLAVQQHRLSTMGVAQVEQGMRAGPSILASGPLAEQVNRAVQYHTAHLLEEPLIEEGTLLTQFAEFPETSAIYLSAGLDTGRGRCVADNDRACNLYRISFRIEETRLTGYMSVQLLGAEKLLASYTGAKGQFGQVQPAVSPDGTHVAFLTRSESETRLRALHVTSGKKGLLRTDTVSEEKAQFPNWFSNTELLYHQGGEGSKHLSLMQVTGYPPQNTGDGAILGVGTGTLSDHSLQDPNTAPDGRITCFGGKTNANGVADKDWLKPMVFERDGTNFEEFNIGNHVLDGRPLHACHHPAWNPNGTNIACSEQSIYDTLNTVQYRLLYNYELSGNSWNQTSQAWAVNVGNPPSFPAPFNNLQGCDRYTIKYSEWCGDNRMMIVTLYCGELVNLDSDPELEENILRSRVYLVYRRSPFENINFGNADLMWIDLTSFLADQFGESDLFFNGVYGTCHT
jgi:hypothetical protein